MRYLYRNSTPPRRWLAPVLASAGLATAVSIGVGQDKGATIANTRSDLALFADPFALLDGNEFRCSVRNQGYLCAQVFATGVGGGGFWPAGTANRYVFNSGLQVAGIVGADGGPWAGDTTGAFFFDPRGTSDSGTPLADVYDSTEPDDLAAWPVEGRITADELFQPTDVGRAAISVQDTWTRYWDGEPNRGAAGRPHPLGISVTQRSMQWNYPSGTESVVYFVFEFENVTADDEFQALNEAQYFGGQDALPSEGYTLTELYVSSSADMDVANASENFSTALLPFDMSITYHTGFEAPGYVFSPQLHYPPFFPQAPGIVGTKFLRTPLAADGMQAGVTFWTETVSTATAFPDPRSADQLWRYLSGNIDSSQGDFPCSVPPEVLGASPSETQRSVCWMVSAARDTRYMLASGPFELAAGETQSIALAYIVAPTLETMPDGSPAGLVLGSANPPGTPSFHPGFPSARGCADASAADCTDVDQVNEVRPIERAAGWVSYDGPAPETALESPSQKLEQFAVETVTHSLLDRALVAQAIFDAKFLRPLPPEPPRFHLLPGDGAVTILWEPSPTDEAGDPYFSLAADPQSVLYNPNYRQFDVIAYELWRGSSPDALEPIRFFRHADRTFVDRTCELVLPSEDIGNPAGPGYAIGEECPADYERETNFPRFFNNGHPGGRPGKGVVRAASGGAALVDSLGALPLPEWDGLPDSEVSFVFRDMAVTNNFTYFYAVKAVDLNSAASGPPVLRSARVTQSVVPRADAPNITNASLSSFVADSEGNPLVQGTMPDIHPEDGIFLGPIEPTNIDMISQGFAPLVPRLLPQLNLQARIDSVKPDWTEQEGCAAAGVSIAFQSTCYRMFITSGANQVEVAGHASNWAAFGRPELTVTEALIAEVPFDQEALDAFGIPSASGFATATFTLDEAINIWEGQQNRRGEGDPIMHGGPRWFSGTTESTPDPAAYIRVGHLAEVDSVWVPIHHTAINPTGTTGTACTVCLPNSGTVQFFGYFTIFLSRSADIRVTWGDGGTVEVRDVTHNVDVPFSPDYGSSWGFLNTDSDGSGAVDWIDFFSVGEGRPLWEAQALGFALPPAELEMTPEIGPIGLGTAFPQGPTHTGFAMYLNGLQHFFVTDELPPAGTVWTLRNYHGTVTTTEGDGATDPTGYVYSANFDGGLGNGSPLIPGLQLTWQVESATNFSAPVDLTRVHTVPDPYRHYSAWDGGGPDKQLLFVNLPPRATVRIYTLGGILVDVIDHDDPTGGGRAPWDLRNRGGRLVASGVYFWHVVTAGGEEQVGKFTVINPDRN